MKKHLFLKSLLVAIGLLIMSINTAWGQSFGAENQRQAQMQSQMMMSSGSSYTGTVYQPFSNTTPSEQSYTPAKAPGSARKGYDPETGEWTPDSEDIKESQGADTGQSELSPVGEPWVMALFALAFAGVIAIRQYKRKKAESMNMKNSTGKFITTLALLCTLGVGQMWAATNWYKQNSDSHIFFNDRISNWAPNTASDHMIFLMGRDNNYGYQGAGSQAYDMKHLANTKLWYYHVPKWGDGDEAQYQFIAFRYSSSAWTDWQSQNVTDRAKHDSNIKYSTTLNDNITGYTKYYAPTSSSAGASMDDIGSISTYTAYLRVRFDTDNTGYDSKITGGDPWGHGVTFDFTGTYLYQDASDNNDYKTGQSTIEGLNKNYWGSDTWGYGSIPVTGEVRFELKTIDSEYEIVGWGTNNDASPSYTTNPTDVTFNVLANTEYVAFIHLKQYTLQYGVYGSSHGTIQLNSEDAITSNTSATLNHGTAISFTAVAADGYKVGGWYNNAACTGDPLATTTTYNAGTLTSAKTVYVKFIPKQCTVNLNFCNGVGDETGYGSSTSATTSVIATYDAAMPTPITLPVATSGYAFMGYFSEKNGSGTKYYNADGSSARAWDVDTETTQTLYADWQIAEFEDFSFDPASAAGDTEVEVTPSFSPYPAGTVCVCWGLYFDAQGTRRVDVDFEDNPSSPADPVTFTTPSTPGAYYVIGKLRIGSTCEGTLLDTYVEQYVVEAPHTITIKYICDGVEIAPRGSVVVPAAGTADVTPLTGDAVFGYSFSSWSTGDGITQTALVGNTITISASYDGVLTANYTKKNIIYFKNTLNWNSVYVNMLTNMKWGSQGTGNDNNCNAANKNKLMSLVPGTDDIYYFEYDSRYISAYVSFTENSYPNSTAFYEESGYALVVYPTRPDAAQYSNGYADDASYGFQASTPMFVPLGNQDGQPYNNSGGRDHAMYYNKGYWCAYDPITHTTGYTLVIYNWQNSTNRAEVHRVAFQKSDREGVILEATVDLESSTQRNIDYYGIKFLRGSLIYTNTGIFSSDGTSIQFTPQAENYAACGVSTPTAGDYTFSITCDGNGALKMGVTYPIAANNYRVLYKDNAKWSGSTAHSASWNHPSRVISNRSNGEDIISFFVSKENSPTLQIQYATYVNSQWTWNNFGGSIDLTAAPYSTAITATGVYNFTLKQNEEHNTISIDKVEPYEGDYYIRTASAGTTGWYDFRADDHKMTYSDYAKENSGFTHYYMKYCQRGTNIKFVIANDYSQCISDTLIADLNPPFDSNMDSDGKLNTDGSSNPDDDKHSANIRFMWDMATNKISRAYMSPHTGSQSANFLVLVPEDNTIIKVGDDKVSRVVLDDKENWVYSKTVYVKPNGRVRMYARYNNSGADASKDQYFIGKYDAESPWTNANSQILISSTDPDPDLQPINILYDFKTNRLITAWQPVNEDPITAALVINADVMIVREGQESAHNVILDGGSLTTEKTIYSVMRFNKYVLNNRNSDGITLPYNEQLPTNQRMQYYLSFPFDVNVSDIFGFGVYGTHYAIRYYDGKGRAKNGYWVDSESNWKWVPPTGKLNAYEGYLLSLSPSKMGYFETGSGEVWANNKTDVELYFPATTKNISLVSSSDYEVYIPALGDEYKCEIERDDRNIKDSYWRCIGIPSLASYDQKVYTKNGEVYTEITWNTGETSDDVRYLYDINWTDNSLIAYSGKNFSFKPMHAYLIQCKNAIYWKSLTKFSPNPIVARRQERESDDCEFRLELRQGENMEDQTYVRLTNDEEVTTGFDFDNDLWKQVYSTRSNIYTRIGNINVAGNVLPQSNQTEVVLVGVQIAADGEYTFAMPEGTNGVSVILIDNIAGTRTNLALTDYTVYLTAGTHDERFILEISPMAQTPTDIESVAGEGSEISGARKVMVDGVLYIVKDGKVFDARGTLCK